MFGEKDKEYDRTTNKELPVIKSPKYIEASDKAKEMINSKKYGLTEGDFWILMNKTKTEKMMYSGLIISHNGCLKINDSIDNKVDPSKFTLDKEGYKGSLVFTYCDDDVYEVGEVSPTNCKNEYPYAMAFKRCFDRVVLKKSQLAYAGVYSDSEADEFTKKDDDNEPSEKISSQFEEITKISKPMVTALTEAIRNKKYTSGQVKEALSKYGVDKLDDLKAEHLADFKKDMDI